MPQRITIQNRLGQKLYLTTNSPTYFKWSVRKEEGFVFDLESRIQEIVVALKRNPKVKVNVEAA